MILHLSKWKICYNLVYEETIFQIAGSNRNRAVVEKLVGQLGSMSSFHKGMRQDVANTRKYMTELMKQLNMVKSKSAGFQRQLNQQKAFTLELLKGVKAGAISKVCVAEFCPLTYSFLDGWLILMCLELNFVRKKYFGKKSQFCWFLKSSGTIVIHSS